ncbi:MAG TPA: hypothetical protein VMT22_10660, partial [Terriglobales bacterium]|nr:hypothetical protein [Terriglobales bacterium]
RRITTKLKAAKIDCFVADERMGLIGKSHFGGLKIQVPRSEAQRAIQLLQEKSGEDILPERSGPIREGRSRAFPHRNDWSRLGMALATGLALAGVLAALYF